MSFLPISSITNIGGFAIAKACGYFLLILNLFLLPYLFFAGKRKVASTEKEGKNKGDKIVTVLPGSDTTFMRALLKGIFKSKTNYGVNGKIEMPKFSYVQRNATVNRLHVNEYNKICGFETDFTIPITYPYCMIFPIQLLLLTDPEFPFPAMGTVHMANKIQQFSPVLCQEVTIKVRAAEELEYFTGYAKEGQRPKTGFIFKVISTLENSSNQIIWRCESTYLTLTSKENKGTDGNKLYKDYKTELYTDTSSAVVRDAKKFNNLDSWKGANLKADMGRRFAAVSGDYNPIHLYNLSAKFLGQKGVLMHGMFTKAAALASICPSPNCINSNGVSFGKEPLAEVYVEFKNAIFLPKKCKVDAQNDASPSSNQQRSTLFEVSSAKKDGTDTHLKGRFFTI